MSFDVHIRDNQLVRHEGCIRYQYGEGRWSFPTPEPNGNRLVGGIPIELRPVQRFQLIQASYTGIPVNHRPEEMNELTMVLGDTPSELLGSLHPVLPLRGFEEWAYPSTKFPGKENLDRLVLPDRGVALTNALSGNSRLRTEISDRLKSLVEIGIDFETASAHRVKVFATSPSAGRAQTLFLNEGTGANQLPFILVPLALAKPGETILLSEPEAHLHPKKQSELSGLLLTIAKKRNLQIFIETHSEHVLHRLLHAVGKGELAKEELALYYFVPEDGKAKVTRLAINDLGQVEGGLPGFFEQSLSELTEYLDALRKP
ncbi:MAG TPA: AAA family ATPase [Terriglobia bacterium]|nr:AAA family ATPase [Terriglobia bacterium]